MTFKLPPLLLGMIMAAALPSFGDGLPEFMKIEQSGALKADGTPLFIQHFDSRWKGGAQSQESVKPEKGFPEEKGKGFLLKGKFKTSSGDFALEESVVPAGPSSVKASYALSSEKGVDTAELALRMSIPLKDLSGRAFKVDGKELSFPAEYSEEKYLLVSEESAKSFVIPLKSGRLVVEGEFPLSILDDRKFHSDNFTIRFGFKPRKGNLKAAELSLKSPSKPTISNASTSRSRRTCRSRTTLPTTGRAAGPTRGRRTTCA